MFFAVTDRAAVRGELEIVAMTARQLDEARAAEDENDPSRDVRIVAPEQQGFVIVRVAAPDAEPAAAGGRSGEGGLLHGRAGPIDSCPGAR